MLHPWPHKGSPTLRILGPFTSPLSVPAHRTGQAVLPRLSSLSYFSAPCSRGDRNSSNSRISVKGLIVHRSKEIEMAITNQGRSEKNRLGAYDRCL